MIPAKRSFSASVAVTLASRWVTLGFTIVSSIIVARCLGPGHKGTFVLTFLLLGQTISVGSFGVPHALVYFSASGRLSRAQAVGHFLLTSLAFSLVLVLPYTLTVFWAGDLLFKGVDRTTLLLVALLIFPSLALANAGGVLRGLGRVDLFNVLRLVESGANLLLLLVALVGLGAGLRGAVVASSIATALAGAAGVGLVLAAARARPRVDLASLPAFLGFGLKSYLTVMLQMTERKLDMFMLGYLLPAATAAWQIGLYSTAVALAELPRTIAMAVSVVLLPKVAAGGGEVNAAIVPRVSRHLIAINVAFGAFLAAVAYPMIRVLYGPLFRPAYLPFIVLLPGVVAAGVWNVFEAEMVGTGRPMRLSMFTGLTLALNFVLNLAAIPRWGIVGAALTSGVTYSLLALCLLLDYRARHRSVALRDLVLVSRREVARYLSLPRAQALGGAER